MIERTRKKLREAAFFFAHLEAEVSNAPSLSPREAVEFFLSAFLSAARSVTTVLQSEAPEAYPEWSPGWRASLTDAERDLLADFTTARNRALKRETPNLGEDWRESGAQRHPWAGVPPELVFFFDGEFSPVAGRVMLGRLTPEAALHEILPLCRQYFELLSRLVATFQEAHK